MWTMHDGIFTNTYIQMIALQSVDFSPLHMAMKLVGQCCSGEVLVLYFAILYWVVDQR